MGRLIKYKTNLVNAFCLLIKLIQRKYGSKLKFEGVIRTSLSPTQGGWRLYSMGHQEGRKWPKRGQRRGAEVFEEGGGSLQGGGLKSKRRGAEIWQKWDKREHKVTPQVTIYSISAILLYNSTIILLSVSQSLFVCNPIQYAPPHQFCLISVPLLSKYSTYRDKLRSYSESS